MTRPRERKLCKHCGKAPVNRPRGLCWHCFYTPGVRDLYPSTSKYARRGEGLGNFLAAPASKPTNAPPGSPAKVQCMIERAARGECLFDPGDAPPDKEAACFVAAGRTGDSAHCFLPAWTYEVNSSTISYSSGEY